jgi:uncharacterized coiled-coil protein SlyX
MKSKPKLMLLILLLTMSLKGFSQSATDSTSIQLKKPTARLVIKDLIKGDGAKQELVLFKEKTILLEQKIVLKDSIISALNSKVSNFEIMVDTQKQQLALSQELSDRLHSDLKKQKIKTKLTGGIGILVAIATTTFLILK